MINAKLLNSFANRGMQLEEDINITNKYYLDNDIAVIHKKPTPIRVSKVIYNGNKKIITEAFYEMPSTTDYNGIYKGKYVDFDAKEVKNLNYFNLSNLHDHQLKHLINIDRHGGIAFLIVRFVSINTTYLISIKSLESFIENNKRKSIPITYFDENAYKLKEGYIPRIDYLKVIDMIMEDL